jgi:hypothetical protein
MTDTDNFTMGQSEIANMQEEEYQGCQCEECNRPDFCLEPDEDAMQKGAKDSSYYLGFLGTLNILDLSEKNLMEILRIRMMLDHEERITRIQLAVQERMAKIDSDNNKKNTL